MNLVIRLCGALESSGEGCYDDGAASATLKFFLNSFHCCRALWGADKCFYE